MLVPLLGAAPTLPSGIQSYAPVTITNSQGAGTAAPFQQMVTINSANYAPYEASNLQNVEFFYANGTIVPSWLEGNPSNPMQTNNLYANTNVYWLSIPQGMASNSNLVIYMGFAQPTTNLFNNNNVGEAAWLSPSYGQYDNGANIFLAYFNGATSPGQFTTPTGYTVARGSSTYGSTTIPVINIQGSYPGLSVYFNFNKPIPNQPLMVETNFETEDLHADTGVVGLVNVVPPNYGGVSTYIGYLSSTTNSSYSYNYGNGEKTYFQNQWLYAIMNYQVSRGFVGWVDAGLYDGCICSLINANPISSLSQIYIGAGANINSGNPVNINFNFGRARAAPPNGVMPSANAGGVVMPTTTTTISSTTTSTASTTTINYYTVTVQESPAAAAAGWGACFGYAWADGQQQTQICAGNGQATASASVPSGSTINLLCTSNWHGGLYNFVDWTGAVSSGTACPSVSVPVTGPLTFTANYQVTATTLTTTVSTSTTSTTTSTSTTVSSTTTAGSTTTANSTTTIVAGGGGGGSGANFYPSNFNRTQPILASIWDNGTCTYVINSTESSFQMFTHNNTRYTLLNKFLSPQAGTFVLNGSTMQLLAGTRQYLGVPNGSTYIELINVVPLTPPNYTAAVLVGKVALCKYVKPPVFVEPAKPPQHVNLSVNIERYFINVTTSVYNDTVNIYLDRMLIASGVGSANYDATWIPAGRYVVEGKDMESGTFINKTLVKPYFNPQLSFIKVCKSSATVFQACTSTAQVVSHNQTLSASLYVNGKFIGSTTNTINYTPSGAGLYNITFKTVGNQVYSPYMLSYQYADDSYGAFVIPAIVVAISMCSMIMVLRKVKITKYT